MEYVRTDPSGRTVDDTVIMQIKQGFEPPNFTCHFHAWDPELWGKGKSYEELKAELAASGQSVTVSVKDVLQDLSTVKKFSYAQLTTEPLPEGVDLANKDQHLNDQEFQTVFGMDRAAFNALPAWKKANLKKKVKLF